MRNRLYAAVVLAIPLATTVKAVEYREVKAPSGVTLRYGLVLPKSYQKDGGAPYPVLVAFPQGKQDEEMVELGLELYWEQEARNRGWVVVCPMVPDNRFFYDQPIEFVTAVLDDVARTINVEGGKFHLAGVGNGGLSAFHFAFRMPERFHSLLVLPGFIRTVTDQNRAATLKGIPVRMYVGETDYAWVPLVRQCAKALADAGVDVRMEVVPGQGHMLRIDPEKLFNVLEGMRIQKTWSPEDFREPDTPERAIGRMLDSFHEAAAQGDSVRYFAFFTDNAVFLGTDPSERWTKSEFQKWAAQHGYMNGKGWGYRPRMRNITLSADGKMAWFDEMLDNIKYGECRGTGVVVRGDGDQPQWLVAQYHLTIPIPNEITADVVRRIEDYKKTEKR